MATKPVIVGVDGSEESLLAVEWAALEAGPASRSRPRPRPGRRRPCGSLTSLGTSGRRTVIYGEAAERLSVVVTGPRPLSANGKAWSLPLPPGAKVPRAPGERL
jgi:hypothetical protein